MRFVLLANLYHELDVYISGYAPGPAMRGTLRFASLSRGMLTTAVHASRLACASRDTFPASVALSAQARVRSRACAVNPPATPSKHLCLPHRPQPKGAQARPCGLQAARHRCFADWHRSLLRLPHHKGMSIVRHLVTLPPLPPAPHYRAAHVSAVLQ